MKLKRTDYHYDMKHESIKGNNERTREVSVPDIFPRNCFSKRLLSPFNPRFSGPFRQWMFDIVEMLNLFVPFHDNVTIPSGTVMYLLWMFV